MNELREFLCALEQWQVWIIGGVAAEVILQIVTRSRWHRSCLPDLQGACASKPVRIRPWSAWVRPEPDMSAGRPRLVPPRRVPSPRPIARPRKTACGQRTL